MNGRIVSTKPLYVALAQRKEERKAHLTNQYMQRLANMRAIPNPLLSSFQHLAHSGYFMPTVPQELVQKGMSHKEKLNRLGPFTGVQEVE
eukprot:g35607.t1